MERFVEVYLGAHRGVPLRVLDVGSQLVVADQVTYRSLFDDPQWEYVGLDVSAGHNVDVAVQQPYRWDEIEPDSFDIVISGQALEHIPYFWLTFFEIGRVMKPGAITMLIAPSSGFEHRYPVDCWRFYRDGMEAMAAYIGFDVVDSFTDWGRPDWADSMLVMRKPQWADDQRDRFAQRRDMQLAAAFGSTPSLTRHMSGASTSALAVAGAGLLSPVLESIRQAALVPPSPAPVPASRAASARQLAKRLVGPRGVAAYRRLRYGR